MGAFTTVQYNLSVQSTPKTQHTLLHSRLHPRLEANGYGYISNITTQLQRLSSSEKFSIQGQRLKSILCSGRSRISTHLTWDIHNVREEGRFRLIRVFPAGQEAEIRSESKQPGCSSGQWQCAEWRAYSSCMSSI